MKQLDIPGVGLEPDRWRQGRLRRRHRRARAWQARTGRRRHALHRRLQHQGDDDAAARRAGRREEAALGRDGDRRVPRVQARRRRHDAASAGASTWSAPAPACRARTSSGSSISGSATPASSMSLLGTMQPTSGFGEVFQYSNLMAAAAGFVGASLVEPKAELGAAYDEAMRAKVFAPLGMTRTTFDFARGPRRRPCQPARRGHRRQHRCREARMDFNYSIVPVAAGRRHVDQRPRAAAATCRWSWRCGKLPDGRRLVSAREPARAPRAAGPDRRGRLLRHGPLRRQAAGASRSSSTAASLFGYHSDMIWLPELASARRS